MSMSALTAVMRAAVGMFVKCLYLWGSYYCVCVRVRRLAGDQRARRDARHDSDAEDDDDVKKVRRMYFVAMAAFTFLW